MARGVLRRTIIYSVEEENRSHLDSDEVSQDFVIKLILRRFSSRMTVFVKVGLVLTLSRYRQFWVSMLSRDHRFYTME